ncbi:MAG: restriction endonuclease subunit S [Caldisericia bacterium]|nr:restriction endonuclease subunit S [Caldisericia bacterium]
MYSIPKDWKLVKFKDVFERITKKNRENNQNVLTISAQYGLISQEEFFNKIVASNDKSNYYLLNKGDFAYNKSYSNDYPYGAFKKLTRYDKGIVSPLYICFTPKENIVPEYYENFFESRFFDKEINAIAQEGARNHGLLNMAVGDFFNTKLPMPPFKEQKQIANILSTWNRAIELKDTLINKKMELLAATIQRYKRKLFESIDFDKWTTTKLKKVFSVRKEMDYESEEQPLYSFTIEKGVSPKTDRYNRSFLVKGDKKYKVTKFNDLVYNPANLKYGAISVNKNPDSVLISPIYETLYVKDTNKYDIDFFKYFLTTSEMISYYKSKVEGTLVERSAVKVDQFLLFTLDVPEYNVQKRVTNHLNTIDKSIDILKRQKEMLELQKKGLMQRLLTGQLRVQV